MCKIIFVSFSLYFSLALSAQCESPTIIRTRNGLVEGIEETSLLGQKFVAFRGIPFAEPPITGPDPYTGKYVDRRFKPTKLLKRSWANTLKAHKSGKSCIQVPTIPGISPDPSDISEDCLFLNIYVPTGGCKKKTVIVYIYGGAFAMGDATDQALGPDFLISEDNILVKIQYRLGIFGFLNLGCCSEYTGNMGLKDQQLALQWIHENIEQFSGNKNQILVFGVSAGGASVQYQMANEISRKYFNRGFAQSTSGFSAWALRRANHIPEIQNCTQIYEMNELIGYLKTANSSAFEKCYPWQLLGPLDPTWVPTIECPTAKKAFMTKPLEDIYRSNNLAMDAMFSFTPEEMITFLPELLNSTEPLIKPNWKETNFTLPFEGFTKDDYPKEYARAVGKLRAVYFSNTSTVDAIRQGNINLQSDATITDGIMKAVAFQANANNDNCTKSCRKKTFLFRFNVNTPLNLINALEHTTVPGVGHGADYCYYFACYSFDEQLMYEKHIKDKDLEYQIIQRLIKLITNFARTGNPSIEGEPPFRPSQSSHKVFGQDFTNEPPIHAIPNIKQQHHYKVWREIEEIYNKLNIFPTHHHRKHLH